GVRPLRRGRRTGTAIRASSSFGRAAGGRCSTVLGSCSARQLLFVRQPYPNHNGAQLQFGPDGLLYVNMGDCGGAADAGTAQNLHEGARKGFLIDPHVRGARLQTIGYGLRNPWRFSFDRAPGDPYIGDVGQSNWEEVDFCPCATIALLANYVVSGAPSASGDLVPRMGVYSHANGCSITTATSTAGAACPPPSAATTSATSARGRSSACASRAAARRGGVRSRRESASCRASAKTVAASSTPRRSAAGSSGCCRHRPGIPCPRAGWRQQRLHPEVGDGDERDIGEPFHADVARTPLRRELAAEAEQALELEDTVAGAEAAACQTLNTSSRL